MIDERHDDPPPRTFAGPQTWAVVRESYLNGVSAPVAKRYGLKADTIWKRAQRQGWIHSAKAETPAPALQPLFPPQPWRRGPASPSDTARDAADAVDRAMREGRLDEATKLARIAATMARVARMGVTG